MPIDKLRLTNVGPFDDIEFEFDPQVNVFTGPNNSGKSAALFALGAVAVYPFVQVSPPSTQRGKGRRVRSSAMRRRIVRRRESCIRRV